MFIKFQINFKTDIAFKFQYKKPIVASKPSKESANMIPSTLAYNVEDSMNDSNSCSTIKKNNPSVNKREIVEVDDSSQEWDSSEEIAKKLKSDDTEPKESKKEVTDVEKLEKKPEPQVNKLNDDDLIDIMLCAICSEIMHNCVW